MSTSRGVMSISSTPIATTRWTTPRTAGVSTSGGRLPSSTAPSYARKMS